MKKIYLSLGAMLLAGAVLASCGGNNTKLKISRPKDKGNAVDSINIKLNNSELSLNKNDEFIDVYNALQGKIYNYDYEKFYTDEGEQNGAKYSYVQQRAHTGKVSRTNYYNDNYFYKKMSETSKFFGSDDVYYKRTTKDFVSTEESYLDSFYNGTSTIEANDYSDVYKENSRTTYGGSYIVDNRAFERKINFGSYDFEYEKETVKTKTYEMSSEANESVYKALNDSEKLDDADYGKRKSGYDTDGKEYGYTLSTFFDEKSNGYLPINMYLYYSSVLKDEYECSFELTDKYIIVKTSTYLTHTVIEETSSLVNDYTNEEDYANQIKEIANRDYKGSKEEIEIWFDYTNLTTKNGDTHEITLVYGTIIENYKVNYKRTYDDQFFAYHNIFNEDIINEYKGMTYTAKGSEYNASGFVVNSEDYSKKITTIRDKAKKNNIFSKIKMTVEESD